MNRATYIRSFISAVLVSGFLLTAMAGSPEPGDPHFALTRITQKIYVIYGPFDLPDAHNHGFRNNPVIVLTSAGAAGRVSISGSGRT